MFLTLNFNNVKWDNQVPLESKTCILNTIKYGVFQLFFFNVLEDVILCPKGVHIMCHKTYYDSTKYLANCFFVEIFMSSIEMRN